jgi:hypothetical protein
MSDLKKLRKEIFTSGFISEAEMDKLKEVLFDDEGINKEKAEFLFEMKDTASKF